jgi:pyruvate/2-oxoglutarate/acetoin dehydrogenase E1 component
MLWHMKCVRVVLLESPVMKIYCVVVGKDITLVSFSRAMKATMEAAEELAKQNISCEVFIADAPIQSAAWLLDY